jgi:hypothetical protein
VKDNVDRLTRKDIEREHIGRYRFSRENHRLADEILDQLWVERNSERGIDTKDRSGSCKFAALLARTLFGGRLVGNQQHVFVVRRGKVLDMNVGQSDVAALGERAHQQDASILHSDYRDSLTSCLPRVAKWCLEFDRRHALLSATIGNTKNDTHNSHLALNQ